MPSWHDFRAQQPQLADAAHGLLYQFGVGLAFLATTRRDGGPRTHPICPLVHDDRLLAFIIPSPKLEDLRRDGRFALHGFPPADNEDAIYLTGRAFEVMDPQVRAGAEQQFIEERAAFEVPPPGPEQALVELVIHTAMLTRTTGHGDPDPQHTIWKASPTTDGG